jgi:uncharacterized protein YbjT (DUF2867 family)
MYVIIGATGNTGSVVTEKLLANREKVRVVGRDAKRLERFSQQGAEAFVADATDAAGIARALTGAKAVYAMIPPRIDAPDVPAYQKLTVDALVAAIDKSGVPYAVVLSSVGADKKDKTGPVLGLHHLEERLQRVPGLNALFLRAGYFMENVLPQAGVIQAFGSLMGPVRADLPLSMIATRDIGAAAADALLKLNFLGKTSRELLGARDVSYADVARVIGEAIGKPGLAYQQVPNAQLKPALQQMGMSSSMVDVLLEMTDSLNSGYMKALEPRTPANTTPTTLEVFVAEQFVPAYRGKAAHAQ